MNNLITNRIEQLETALSEVETILNKTIFYRGWEISRTNTPLPGWAGVDWSADRNDGSRIVAGCTIELVELIDEYMDL